MRIAIVGGGAAGMMVAATLCEREDLDGMVIDLFEKNSKLGAKVIISGGGRCNVTTGLFKSKELLTKYPRGADFLKYALEKFGPKAIRRWFESHGVPLKQEADGRIFPVSDNGKDIVGVFEKLFGGGLVNVHLKESVVSIKKDNEEFYVETQTATRQYDRVVITTGGNAYAHTGSAGDGYGRARALGHTITPLGPSLNSFLTAQKRLHACSGIVFQDAQLSASLGNHALDHSFSVRGSVLLTHFGISGPATFAFSSHIPYREINEIQPFSVFFQPLASMGQQQREERFLHYINQSPKKEIATALREFFPKKFADLLLIHNAYDVHTSFASLTKEQRKFFCILLGGGYIILDLIQRRPGDEFVTAGGVCLDEVDPKTGQSLITPGLFFAGEILDVDGYTGGYNLTSSWAMGRRVGKSI